MGHLIGQAGHARTHTDFYPSDPGRNMIYEFHSGGIEGKIDSIGRQGKEDELSDYSLGIF